MHDKMLLALLLKVFTVEFQAIQIKCRAILGLEDALNDDTLKALL
jgi:hypothetical protein